MPANNASTIILKSLYRSLLKQSRILDQSPIHQCFLVSKPKKIYIHEYGTPVNVRLYNTDFEIIERILNEHCGGEYFAPSYPNQEVKSLQSIVRQYFRFGIPSKYDPLKILEPAHKNQSDQQILNKYLELAFYSKKRLSYSTNVIQKMAFNSQTQFLTTNTSADKSSKTGKYTRMDLPSEISLNSLTPLQCEDSISDPKDIRKGTLLISHPLSCLGQPDLYRKIIYIIENSSDRIVGITLNSANSLFDDNARKSNKKRAVYSTDKLSVSDKSEFEYCFRGWKGEWNYIGGPVNDQNCPFCILHKNKAFSDKFSESSTVIIENDTRTYWTWVTADNYQNVYHSLNIITRIIQHKNECKLSEISGKNEEETDEAQIISENVEEKTEEKESESEEDITKNEFYESIMSDHENDFKFFQKYAYWSPEQLMVEVKNNVWFAAKLTDSSEEKQLLHLKCPSPKLLGLKGVKENARTDYKKQFNKWMWQALVKGLGNEYESLAEFPDFNNEQTKEFYSFMEEFHNSWVPDVEQEDNLDSDDEEEGTVW